jgi:hypothetical protein
MSLYAWDRVRKERCTIDRLLAVGFVVCVVFTNCPTVVAQFRYRKIADTTTLIPSGTGTFISFTDAAYDGQNVLLLANGASGQAGVYLWNGSTLTALADVGSTIPNGGGTFTGFSRISIDAGNVAFVATGSMKDGVYTTVGGGLRKVADVGTLMPGSTASFTQFTFSTDVAVDGSNVYFDAMGTDGASVFQEGVYRDTNGVLTSIVDRNTTIPDNGNKYIFFDDVDAQGGKVVFGGGRGSGGGNGIYTTLGASSGPVRTVMNTNTVVPGLTNPLATYSPNDARISGSNIAFGAESSGSFSHGLYLEGSGVIEQVADSTITNPANGSKYSSIGNYYALSGSNVAFSGSSGGPTGLFLKRDAGVSTVLHTANSLDKKDISSLSVYGESLAGEKMVFGASFSDGSSGLYLAEPYDVTPGPSSTTFAPVFDASANGSTVSGTGLRIDVQNRPSSGVDERAILEFNVASLPAAATLKTVQLEIKTSLLTSNTTEGPTLAVYGYTGDGILTAADRLRTDVFLGESPMVFNTGTLRFNLDPLAVAQVLQGGGFLGLVGIGSFNGNQLGFDSKELSSSSGAKLIVTYGATLPGDFDLNGKVNAADYVVWRNGLGSTYTAAHYDDWRAHFGSTLSTGAGLAAAVPEPGTLVGVLVACAFAVGWRGGQRLLSFKRND